MATLASAAAQRLVRIRARFARSKLRTAPVGLSSMWHRGAASLLPHRLPQLRPYHARHAAQAIPQAQPRPEEPLRANALQDSYLISTPRHRARSLQLLHQRRRQLLHQRRRLIFQDLVSAAAPGLVFGIPTPYTMMDHAPSILRQPERNKVVQMRVVWTVTVSSGF